MNKEAMFQKMEEYLTVLKHQLDAINKNEFVNFLEILLNARERGSTIFIMGNGGSAATASHFVCDFNKGLKKPGEKRFRFICLNDNVPSLMAYANDQGYGDIFAEQLENLAAEGDVVIGISGSGNSENVLRAMSRAAGLGCVTVALVGYNGGKMKALADHCVHIELDDMQIVEDVHMILDHMGMRILHA